MDMQFQFSLDVAAFIALLIAGIAAFVRLQSKAQANAKEIERIEKMHEKDIAELKQNHAERDKAIWAKLDDLSKLMVSAVQSLGRLEGKHEADRNRP